MSDVDIYFTRTELDRCADMRDQVQRLNQLKSFKKCHYLPVHRGNHLYIKEHNGFYFSDRPILDCSQSFLGVLNDELWFSCGVIDDEVELLEKKLGGRFSSLRQYALSLDDDLAHIALYSRGLDLWQRHTVYCSICGTTNTMESSGHKMTCENGHEQFPHIEPAIIVMVTQGDKCLLGRKHSWPANVYSTLAGFVEPGETIEDSVHREVYEESNIRINHVRYFGSQPWPFPSSLMLAFTAEAVTSDIRLNDEMEDVQWFSRSRLINWVEQGSITLSPRFSVANNLINWFLKGA